MSPGSSTESYPAFARIGLRENPGKNLNQVTFPDRDSNPGHLVSRPDALTVTPQLPPREVRSVIKFLNAQGIAPIEIDRQLCQVYGPNVMSKQMVRCSTRSKKKKEFRPSLGGGNAPPWPLTPPMPKMVTSRRGSPPVPCAYAIRTRNHARIVVVYPIERDHVYFNRVINHEVVVSEGFTLRTLHLTDRIHIPSLLRKIPQRPPCRSEAKLLPRVGPPRVPLQKPSNIAELHSTETGRERGGECNSGDERAMARQQEHPYELGDEEAPRSQERR
ncbi:hypothetical protein ANN_01145 [Periplaneta americana]|uniref:Uncharacterized protein n=1 Tax=Periplaneta americana TaxID=6978 RepID=A0ABQ8TSR5_PERAM|nr:hypothetical protein ANN_01145 [Periplaneta americana]